MEKTETEKPSGEGADFCDGSDSNDESLEPENELRRGSEEQPVRQGGFVQQPAKQEAVPRASEQKVFKEVDELEKEVWRMLNGIVDRWEKSTGKKF
mmetsp:Transcript_1429/g.1771  ORF Transcript_1429/g.1771 Transcript_1429/m.1771 type:complete len:96 (+) Transcript_1429:121-408(+)